MAAERPVEGLDPPGARWHRLWWRRGSHSLSGAQVVSRRIPHPANHSEDATRRHLGMQNRNQIEANIK